MSAAPSRSSATGGSSRARTGGSQGRRRPRPRLYGQLKRDCWLSAAIAPGALVATTLATPPRPPSACASAALCCPAAGWHPEAPGSFSADAAAANESAPTMSAVLMAVAALRLTARPPVRRNRQQRGCDHTAGGQPGPLWQPPPGARSCQRTAWLEPKLAHGEVQWARLGSNQRPLACEASALPLSYAPVGGTA